MPGNLECYLICEMNQRCALFSRAFWREHMQTRIGLFCSLIYEKDRVQRACTAYWLSEKILTCSCWQHSKIFRSLNNSPSCTEPGWGRRLIVSFSPCLWIRDLYLDILTSEKVIVALGIGWELGMLCSLTVIGSWETAVKCLSGGRWLSNEPVKVNGICP